MKQLWIVAACSFSLTLQAKDNLPPYKDATLPVEQRVEDLLSRMTLEEKVAQLNMKSLNGLKTDEKGKVTEASLEALFKGGSIGCLESPFVEHEKVARFSEAADRYLRTKTRLGIPAIQIAECLHGQMALGATIYPQAIAQGATWNPALVKQMAANIAREATLSGVDQALSPLFDLARDPRYGRVEECYGEDPFLVKQMGVAYVIGMQGKAEASRRGIAVGKMACTGKHFAAYSVPQAGINLAPALVGERELRETHFYPFEGVVKEANIYSLMPGYHELDGVPVHANPWLLQQVLRDEWGFQGYVFSDYSAISMLTGFHRTATDAREAAVQALAAGVDLEAPGTYAYGQLVALINEGKLPEAQVDAAVRRILRAKFLMGLFDRPFKVDKKRAQKIHTESDVALSRQIAEESVVLLKNANNRLPLDKGALHSVAVIGPNADKVQFGDYSITKNNAYGVTVYQGIKRYLGDGIRVSHALGCGITSLSTDSIAQAVQLARESDVTVLVLGGTSVIYSGIGWGDPNSKEVNTCGEGYDRNELDFPGVQRQLLEAVTATGKPVVLVMLNGRPLTIGDDAKRVDAVLEAWYPGERGGEAVARILFGEVNPSGRLPMTFPPTTGHIPMYAAHKPSGKGYYRSPGTPEHPGRDYVFSAPKPLYPFGYGLSYTTFAYSALNVPGHFPATADSLDVTLTLTNTGDRDGAEVVQLYVNDRVSSVTTPVKALKAFAKVFLKSGESKQVSLAIAKSDLALWNKDMKRVIEPGEFEVLVGASAEDIKLKGKFQLTK